MRHNFKRIIVTIIAFISLTAVPLPAITQSVQASTSTDYKADKIDLAVKSGIAIDSKTGQILYAKNANKTLPIASMTKLVTVYLTLKAIQQKKLSWQTKIKPTAAIVKVANNSEYSNVPLKQHHSYTIRQLYQATLIESANGAAMCLAQAVSGSQKVFVKKMRQQLHKWKINDAKIYTVCGLPNGNLGKDAYPGVSKNAENTMSAKDMAIVGQNLIKTFPEVLKTTKIAHFNFKDQNKTTVMTNFNWMLKGLSQYDPNLPVDGLKTGTTDAAGACFIGTIKYKGARIITVVMGARHRNGNDPARFTQTKKMMHWIFANYTPVVMKKGAVFDRVQTINVTNGDQNTVKVGLKHSAEFWDPVDGKTLNATLTSKNISAPISKGQTVSYYRFKSGKEKLISLTEPKGMKVAAQSLQNDGKVNFFVQIWRFITGAN